MKLIRSLLVFLLLGWSASAIALAQTYVTPKMGGGQVTADMVHIDLYYDAEANTLHARVDDSYGLPELRPLAPGAAFDPRERYAVLNGKAYNSQYGWNVGGFFTIPPGAAIWIEQTRASPGLECYENWGRLGSYAPIFGTASSPRLWKWSGVMIHNTYAVSNSPSARLFADYHIYFGDADTGSRDGFTQLADTSVRLEWTTVPVEDPLTFKFGAADSIPDAPLLFLNSGQFVTNSQWVMNLRYTNAGPYALQYACRLPLMAVPATAANGGPAANHAALGSCLELQVVSLAGPLGASLHFWEAGETQACFSVPVGEVAGTNRFPLSENQGAPDADPFGGIQERHFTAGQPGLFCLGFRLVDTSTNGPDAGPIHPPSETYYVYLQAGLTIASWAKQGASLTASFGGEPDQRFYLEHTPALGASAQWQTVAGPLIGTNRLQTLTDPAAADRPGFFRLRAQSP